MADETVSQGSDASYAAQETSRLSPRQQRQVFDTLICVSDMLSEALASAEAFEGDACGTARDNLLEINREIWKLRWELALFAGRDEPAPPCPAYVAPSTSDEQNGGAA